MWSFISSAIGGIVKPVVGYFKDKQDIHAQLQENKLKVLKAVGDRQAQLYSQGLAADATWEMESLRAGTQYRGFELWIISIPLVMCFTPYSYVVDRGFHALADTPSWFRMLVLTIYLANYGIRLWRRNIRGKAS